MKIRAYAKINLALDVVRRLENGYHDLNMCMLPIDFYDLIVIDPAPEDQFLCNKAYIQLDDKNTVVLAYRLMKQKYQFTSCFKIQIIKNIPTQAGLAGGSTDAAALIKGLNYYLKLKMSDQEIQDICLQVGADVPFTYYQKPAIVTGIGDRLDFFNPCCDFEILLVKPKKGVSTKKAFESLDLTMCDHPDIDALKCALVENDYQTVIQNMKNSLEASSFKLLPEIEKIKNKLLDYRFDAALMSGSGSTVFAITKDQNILDFAYQEFKKMGYFVRKCRVLK